jgi:amphi-Trp domain-containing protein
MATRSDNGSESKSPAVKKARKTNGSAARHKREGNGAEASDRADEKAPKGKLHFESMLTRDEAAAYFEAIVKGLRKGSIHFHQSDDSLVLAPADHVGVEVKATQKSGREKLSFELVWRTDKGSELTIVAGDAPPEPAPEPEAAAAS